MTYDQGIRKETLRNPERFENPPFVGKDYWQDALAFPLRQIRRNMKQFSRDRFPAPNSTGLVYPAIANTDWTACFWTGQLWLAYELSGDDSFRVAAEGQLDDYRARLDERRATDTHDLGFLYTLSHLAAWRLIGNESSRQTALKAADLLMVRYSEKAGVIQAWGDLNDPAQKGRIIIDCVMNLPLLYWASEETGNMYYRTAAVRHLSQANRHLLRPDASTYHTYHFDVTGKPLHGTTAQGYADDSCWARGHAWAIYGLPLSYAHLRDAGLLETARRLAVYFLNRLPADMVAYWDLVFTQGSEERDSSAAVIAASGLLELSSHLPYGDPDRRIFENAGMHILYALRESYTAEKVPHCNGLLLHAVYNKPAGHGVDECAIWGDYFYLEALSRMVASRRTYW